MPLFKVTAALLETLENECKWKELPDERAAMYRRAIDT